MGNKKTRKQVAIDVCNYILDNDRELDDFAENPSDNHVFYLATWYVEGKREANLLLKRNLLGLGPTEESPVRAFVGGKEVPAKLKGKTVTLSYTVFEPTKKQKAKRHEVKK